MIYNSDGNLANEAAFKAADKIGRIAINLFKRLLKEGMTIVEGRALSEHLKSQISIASIIQLMKAQCKESNNVSTLA